MATWNASSPSASPCSSRRRTRAPARRPSSESPPPRKMKSMAEIMAKSLPVVEHEQEEDKDSYSDVTCEKCGSGEGDDELLLCDKCDRGFHMKCLRPIVVRVPIGPWLCLDCSDQRPVRSRDFFFSFKIFVLKFLNFFLFLMFFVFQNFGNFFFLSGWNVLGLSQKKILHFFRIEKQIDRTDKSELSQGTIFVFGFDGYDRRVLDLMNLKHWCFTWLALWWTWKS